MAEKKKAFIKLNIVLVVPAADIIGGEICRLLEGLNDAGAAAIESTESFTAPTMTAAAKIAGVLDL